MVLVPEAQSMWHATTSGKNNLRSSRVCALPICRRWRRGAAVRTSWKTKQCECEVSAAVTEVTDSFLNSC